MAKKSTPKKKVKAKATTKKAVKKTMPKSKKAVAKTKPVVKKKVVKAKPVVKKKVKNTVKPSKLKKQVAVKAKAKKPIVKTKKPIAKTKKPIVKTKKPIVKAKKPVVKAKKTVAKSKVKVQPKKKVIKKVTKKPVVVKTKPKVKKTINKPKVKVQPKKKVVKKPVKKLTKVVAKPKPKKVVKKSIAVAKKVKKVVTKPVQKVIEKVPPKPIAPRHNIVPIKNALKFEVNYNRADMFYKNVLKAESVKRYLHDKEEDKEFLAKDQSLFMKIADKETTISEKIREQDWNDIYVEIFKKYPHEEGWIKVTEADHLAYFFPGRVFWAKMDPIKMLCHDILSKAFDSGIYKELYYMYPKNSGRLSKTFKINTKTYSFNFIQTYHEDGENSYYSIGISLPFVLLMDFRIDYKIFKQ